MADVDDLLKEYTMYKIIDNDNILPVDVDGTLIKYMSLSEYIEYKEQGGIDVFKAYYGGEMMYLRPMRMNIALLKHHKTVRNFYIRVHSANGKEWAEKIVNLLKLNDYVDSIETKAHKCVDDKPISDWMPTRIFLEDFE